MEGVGWGLGLGNSCSDWVRWRDMGLFQILADSWQRPLQKDVARHAVGEEELVVIIEVIHVTVRRGNYDAMPVDARLAAEATTHGDSEPFSLHCSSFR